MSAGFGIVRRLFEDPAMHDVILIDPMYSNREHGTFVRETADFYSGSPVFIREPIAIQSIAGYLRKNAIRVDVIHQTTTKDEDVLDAIAAEQPTILGVSVHSTHVWPRILEFLKRCKQRFPELIIVCGGNHPSRVPDIIAEEPVDYVVRGEGEGIFLELVTAILGENPDDIAFVKGISYKQDGKIIHAAGGKRYDFFGSPWALRKESILKDMKCAPLCYPAPPEQVNVAQISYSRGCHFTCDFCVSPLVFPGKVQFRDPIDTVDEIEHLQQTYGTNFLFFNDLTFNIYREKTLALCSEIIKRKLKIYWFAYCSVHLKEDVVAAMAEAGCTRVGIGVETFSDEMTEIYKPQWNLERTHRALDLVDRYGIMNRIYLMIGYAEETREILAQMPNFMKALPIDQPRLAFITPFPGTPFYETVKDKITTHELEHYSGDYPIIRNERISAPEYIEIRNSIMREFYTSSEYLNHVTDKCRRFPLLRPSFQYFIDYLNAHHVLDNAAHVRFTAALQVPSPALLLTEAAQQQQQPQWRQATPCVLDLRVQSERPAAADPARGEQVPLGRAVDQHLLRPPPPRRDDRRRRPSSPG
jgi:anaerobic magnesium-protoporphyrin IX monomethyl ester cyclase